MRKIYGLRVPAPSLIWFHGRWSGDMMIDGVPDVRVAEDVRSLNLFGKSTLQRGVATGASWSWPQASVEMGKARAQRMVRRPPCVCVRRAAPGRRHLVRAGCDSNGGLSRRGGAVRQRQRE